MSAPRVRVHHHPPMTGALTVPAERAADLPAPLRAAASAGRFRFATGETVESLASGRRMVAVGLGHAPGPKSLRAAGAAAAAALLGEDRVVLDARARTPNEAALFAEGAVLRAWRPDGLRARPDPEAPRLSAIDLVTTDAAPWQVLAPALEGASFARDLVALPANHLTPSRFVHRLRPLARLGIAVEVLAADRLAAEGFGGLLAVGGASAHPPALVLLRWAGGGGAPVALVGKGITFDTGGVSIKPAEGMWEMRADMAGAAACAGAILALARRRSKVAAVAVLALAENAIGARAYRPGDVLRSFSGRTVEVVDTDAEGRLVLADALSYAARRLRPAAMVDLATLTGSIVLALGHERAGLFAADPGLGAALAGAGEAVGELVWPMPIGERHRADLDSAIADLRHCLPGRMQPDACHAAAFLREFAEGVPWAHLDIAGVESRDEADAAHAAGATGFGVRLLDRFLTHG